MKCLNTTLATALTVVALLSVAPMANATAPACGAIFYDKVPVADLAAQAEANYLSPNIEAYKSLKTLLQNKPSLASTSLVGAMHDLLKDESLSTFHTLLKKVIDKTAEDADVSGASDSRFKDILKGKLEAELKEFMPDSMAAERAALLERSSFNKESLMQALGKMTQEQSVQALVGPNGIHNITADSLVGRFIAKSREAGVDPASLVERFLKTPAADATAETITVAMPDGTQRVVPSRGPERLYLSVDARTAKLAEQIFGKSPHHLIHNHGSGQGTLHLNHTGKDISYGRYGSNQPLGYYEYNTAQGIATQLNLNTIAPLIVLSSTEASKATNYFSLGLLSPGRTQFPSGLKDRSEGATSEQYCRFGGYTSCTHWFGEMPLGDRLVDTYSFPGQPDGHAGQADPLFPNAHDVRSAPVGSFTHFQPRGLNADVIGFQTRSDRLIRMVWRQGQGHEQMWSMLGTTTEMMEPLQQGELANPGWVLYTELAKASAERIPVVLVYRQDAAATLSRAGLDALRANISAY